MGEAGTESSASPAIALGICRFYGPTVHVVVAQDANGALAPVSLTDWPETGESDRCARWEQGDKV